MDQVRQLGSEPERVPAVSLVLFRFSTATSDGTDRGEGCTHYSSRSVFERALDVEPTNIKLWLSYTEMVRARRHYFIKGDMLAEVKKTRD